MATTAISAQTVTPYLYDDAPAAGLPDPTGHAIVQLGGRYADTAGDIAGIDNGLFYLNDTYYYDPEISPSLGFKLFLARIDPELNSTTQILLGDDHFYRSTALGDGVDGGVTVASESDLDYAAYLTMLDSGLNVTHSLRLGADQGSVVINGVDAGSNDRTVAVGYESVAGDAEDAYIVSLNADASVHAEFHFDDAALAGSSESFSAVRVLADNSVLAWNDSQLFKFDQDLTLERAVEFDTTLDSVVERPDGSLLVLDASLQDVFRLDDALNVTDAWRGARDFGPGQFNILPSDASLSDDALTLAAGRDYQADYSLISFDLDDFTAGSSSVQASDVKAVDDSYLGTTAALGGRSASLGSDRETLYVSDAGDDSTLTTSQGSISQSDFAYAMAALGPADDAYPAAQALDWSGDEISLVGVADYTATHVSDGLTLSA